MMSFMIGGLKGIAFAAVIGLGAGACRAQDNRKADRVIQVDLHKKTGPMTPVWAWFGYDEPNYTYMKDGKKLLTEIAALSPVLFM